MTGGTRVGIFVSWSEAAAAVTGVSGSVHESFKSRTMVEEFYYYNKDHGNVVLLAL